MTLVVDELYNGIVFEQNFKINRSISLAHFRPWIYKHGVLASGDLICEFWQNGELLKSALINFADINEQIPGTYAHGQIRFDLNAFQMNHDSLQDFTEYTVKIYMDNYTNAPQFIGVVRRYEKKFYETYGEQVIDGEAPNDMVEPMGFELFEYK